MATLQLTRDAFHGEGVVPLAPRAAAETVIP